MRHKIFLFLQQKRSLRCCGRFALAHRVCYNQKKEIVGRWEGTIYEKTGHRNFGPCGRGQNDAERSAALSDRRACARWAGWTIGTLFWIRLRWSAERGITIFSKQAVFTLGNMAVTLLDTPGHVDFSAEMERTLQVLDYAILVVSGTDGVQGHTQTLWNLLRRHKIPTFVFVNKMDLAGADRPAVLAQLQTRFGDGCVDFTEENDGLCRSCGHDR